MFTVQFRLKDFEDAPWLNDLARNNIDPATFANRASAVDHLAEQRRRTGHLYDYRIVEH